MKAFFLILLLPVLAFAERPTHWAQPVKSEAVNNWYRVTENLYRCAQPSAEGLRELEKAGVRTVICLRSFHDNESPDKDSNLRLELVKMHAWDVDEDEIVRVLALLREKDQGPFAVHCLHGADRTGLIVAMHRIVDLEWKKEDALAELRNGGFGHHKIFFNISRYIRGLDEEDIAKLRKKVAKRMRRDAEKSKD